MALLRTSLLLAAFAIAALAVPPPAAAQGRIVARHGDWQIRCDRDVGAPGEQCALIQNVQAQDRANVSLSVLFLRTADQQVQILRVLAPLGVLLPPGLGLSIDGNEVGLAGFVRCLTSGCVAEVQLDDGLIQRFQAGETATFSIFQTPEEGIGIPISLDGFGEGFAALEDPPTDTLAADLDVPRAPIEADTRVVERPGGPEAVAFAPQVDERSPLDRLLEDELFPYAAGVVAAVLLLIVLALVLWGRRRGRRQATAKVEPVTQRAAPAEELRSEPVPPARPSAVDRAEAAPEEGAPGGRATPRLAPPVEPRREAPDDGPRPIRSPAPRTRQPRSS
ncbi:invasion associated locus B family protein [Acuticoccus sp.]|uniref:invasion associated locus B family protein n=1 Tax=Acuticoccus sp. TaxID=1904378 RepID=UPI003B516315